jgi:hypothetical protein
MPAPHPCPPTLAHTHARQHSRTPTPVDARAAPIPAPADVASVSVLILSLVILSARCRPSAMLSDSHRPRAQQYPRSSTSCGSWILLAARTTKRVQHRDEQRQSSKIDPGPRPQLSATPEVNPPPQRFAIRPRRAVAQPPQDKASHDRERLTLSRPNSENTIDGPLSTRASYKGAARVAKSQQAMVLNRVVPHGRRLVVEGVGP